MSSLNFEMNQFGKKKGFFPSTFDYNWNHLRFGLVSLFNGISTFVGYLMPKSFSWKNSSGTI